MWSEYDSLYGVCITVYVEYHKYHSLCGVYITVYVEYISRSGEGGGEHTLTICSITHIEYILIVCRIYQSSLFCQGVK